MISAVLVPLDGSPLAEQAIPYARALLPDGGQIVLLRVLPELEPPLTEMVWVLGSSPAEFGDAQSEAARAELEAVQARLADPRLRWTTRIARGDPATQILQAIPRYQIGLVAMTTHGRGAIGRAVFGSVADRVSRIASVPVLLVRPGPDGAQVTVDMRRLLVPLDGSAVAEGALPIAVELAQRLRRPVRLLRAVDQASLLASLNGGGMLAAPPSAELGAQVVEAAQREARDYLEAVAPHLQEAGVAVSWAVLDGSPFFAIADATETGDLIVLTSHGRSGVRRWFLGSVAEKLVREAPVPVLLVPWAPRASPEGGG